MKWIGQHIWSFISRFRNDVYLESVSSGTIASGGNLGLDSNNKIVKADTESGELTITNAGDNRIITSTGGTGLNAEEYLDWDGDSLVANSPTAGKPIFTLVNSHSNAVGPSIVFQKTDTNGADNDQLGFLNFFGHNDNNQDISFAKIHGKISDATDGEEAGKIELQVAEYDGTLTTGLLVDGDTDADGEVDVVIGAGAGSTTTIAGTLTMGSTAFVNNSGVVQVATQGTIDHDSLANFVANEHIDWTASSAGTIHASNYSDTAGWHGSDTRIKILPRDFVANDGGRPMMIEDDSIGSNELFLFSFSSFDTFAYIPIPTGYKATHVRIYGSDTGQDFYVYEGDINSKTITDVATGSTSIGTEKTLDTEVTSDTTNYLIVRVTSDGATDEIHGGYVTIATV